MTRTANRFRRSAAALAAMALFAAAAETAAAQDQAPSPNPLGGLSKDALKNFRDRPLFNPARSEPHRADAAAAPEPTAEAAPPPADPPPDLHLVGVVSGDQSLAVVRLANSAKTRVLATGDKLGAWSVTVLGSGLLLESDTRRVEFALFAPRTADPAATPPGQGADGNAPPADHPPAAGNPSP